MVGKITLTGTILKWGNSYGIRINKEEVERMRLQEKQQVEVAIKPIKNPLLELWGSAKDNPITKEDFLRIRRELEGEFGK
ncbi:hypothetical protein JXA12_02590 [Candidatus Woesearchaeota archaeon]|nr:hypothetical protein [Candidatus Woesearchaeota archaeon]